MNKNSRSIPRLNRLLATVIAATIAFGSASTVKAANWFKLRGTEPDTTTHTQQAKDSLQPTSDNCDAGSISGDVGKAEPLNCTLPTQDTVSPQRTDKSNGK